MDYRIIEAEDFKINLKIYLEGHLKATLNRSTEDSLFVEITNNATADVENGRDYRLFKKLTLYYDSFGEAHSLEIESFLKDGWSRNRDLLEYVLVSHFDINEKESKQMVDKILSSFG